MYQFRLPQLLVEALASALMDFPLIPQVLVMVMVLHIIPPPQGTMDFPLSTKGTVIHIMDMPMVMGRTMMREIITETMTIMMMQRMGYEVMERVVMEKEKSVRKGWEMKI